MAEIKLTFKKYCAGQVIFELESGGEVVLPRKILPRPMKESDTLVMELLPQKLFEARKQDIAKAILDEILSTNEKAGEQNIKKEE